MAAYDGWSMNGGEFNGARTGFPFDGSDVGALDKSLFSGIGGSSRPQFDEYTGSLRTPLSAYATQADKGNVQAAAAYQESLGMYRDAQRRYGMSRGIGLNDATATSALRISDDRGRRLEKDLLTTRDSYVDRFNAYLAAQAKQRGYSPDHLIGEEDEMDSAIQASYTRYLNAAKAGDPRGMTEMSGVFEAVPGFKHDMSLKLRESLSRYEGANGLYSTTDRVETLDEAARLLSRIHGNAKLNARLGHDYDAVIGMAAKRVLKGDRSANIIDLVDGDLATIGDGFVTYSGSTIGDSSRGYEVRDKSGRPYTTGLAPLVQGVLADQAIEDRLAGRERFSDTRALRGRLVDSLSRRYSAAGNRGYDRDTQDRVWGGMADSIIEMARSGGVNLSKLSGLWTEKPDFVQAPMPAVKAFDWNKLGDFGDRMVEQLIGGRPMIYDRTGGPAVRGLRYGLGKVGELFGGDPVTLQSLADEDKKFTDPETVRKDVRTKLAAYLKDNGFDRESLAKNAKSISEYADRMADLIVWANTTGDPTVAGSGDRAAYAKGGRTVLASLAMMQNLEDIGFDVPTDKRTGRFMFQYGGKFGDVTSDAGLRYRDQRLAFENSFGDLDRYLDEYVKSVKDPEKLDDQSFVRYQAALSYRDGIKAMRSALDGSVSDADSVKEKLLFAQNKLGLMLGVDGYGETVNGIVKTSLPATGLPAVKESWEARAALNRKQARSVADPAMIPAHKMLDDVLQAGFSDRINPVKDQRIRELAVDYMDEYGKFIQGKSYDAYLNLFQQAIATAVQDIGFVRRGTDADGRDYEIWDPLEPYLGNDDFKKAVTAKIGATIKTVSDRSKMLQDKANETIALASGLRSAANRRAVLEVNESAGL